MIDWTLLFLVGLAVLALAGIVQGSLDQRGDVVFVCVVLTVLSLFCIAYNVAVFHQPVNALEARA